MLDPRKPLFLGVFLNEADILAAARAARTAGYRIHDAYTPYAVHGLDQALGLRPSRLPWVCFACAVTGLSAAWAAQYWMSAIDWPLNVGGKPRNSTLAFVPITFELTILFAGLATAGALLLRSRLLPGAPPRVFAPGATEDVFAVVLRKRDATFDAGEARRLLIDSGAYEVRVTEVGP